MNDSFLFLFSHYCWSYSIFSLHLCTNNFYHWFNLMDCTSIAWYFSVDYGTAVSVLHPLFVLLLLEVSNCRLCHYCFECFSRWLNTITCCLSLYRLFIISLFPEFFTVNAPLSFNSCSSVNYSSAAWGPYHVDCTLMSGVLPVDWTIYLLDVFHMLIISLLFKLRMSLYPPLLTMR